jgi:hypothetical protein
VSSVTFNRTILSFYWLGIEASGTGIFCLLSAVSLQGGITVRANDSQILKAIIVSNAVDMIKD